MSATGNALNSAEPIEFTIEDPVGPIARALIDALCVEMEQRYGQTPSPFSPTAISEPLSVFLVAWQADQAVGCGAVKRWVENIGEIKRMYVAPSARRQGLARRILMELETHARGFGFHSIRLETGIRQPEAQALYTSLGYTRIPAFGPYVGNPTSVCFEKQLAANIDSDAMKSSIKTTPASGQRLEELDQFRALGDRLGTSGQPSPEGFGSIRQAGFEVVINLALPTSDRALANEGSIVTGLGMIYVHLPVDFQTPRLSDFDDFCRLLDVYAERKVFVHCAANKRVSAFVYLYRILRQGMAAPVAKTDLLAIWEPDTIWKQFMNDTLQRRLTPDRIDHLKEAQIG